MVAKHTDTLSNTERCEFQGIQSCGFYDDWQLLLLLGLENVKEKAEPLHGACLPGPLKNFLFGQKKSVEFTWF